MPTNVASWPTLTCFARLEGLSYEAPDAVALLAAGRPPLTYQRLWAELEKVTGHLRRLGVRPDERVAVVLPNGPEMALAFLATSACATCAPLNPAFRAEEFEFSIQDLQVRTLMVQAGLDTPARHTS